MKRCVIFPTESGEFLQFLPLLAVQVARHFDEQARVEIAAFATVNVRDAFAAQTKALPALRAGRDFQARFSFQSRHRNLAAERRGREGDRHFAKEIVVLALKDRVFLNVDDDVKVALASSSHPRFAVMAGAQARAMGDPRRDFDFDPAGFFDPTLATAGVARFLNHFAKTAALRAGLRDLEKSARADDLAAPATGRAGDGARAG